MDGAGALPLDAAFGLCTAAAAPGDRPATLVVVAGGPGEAAASGGLCVHRVEAVAAAAAAVAPAGAASADGTAIHSSWLAFESVEAIVGATSPTRLARGSWVAVPCAHAAGFLPRGDASSGAAPAAEEGRYCHLWNPATDALLLPRPGRIEGQPSPIEVVGVAPAAAAVAAAAVGGGWEWRCSSPDGEAGRVVWRGKDGAAWPLVLAEGGGAGCGSEWRLVQHDGGQRQRVATELKCCRREWMGAWYMGWP